MIRRAICALTAAALVLTTTCCGVLPGKNGGKLQVVCTLFPYYDFVRQIGGEDVDSTLLIAAGREVHSFEPTPLDAVRLSRADVFIYNGGESEAWVEELLEAAGEDIGITLAMIDYAELLEEEMQDGMQAPRDSHVHDHDDHDHDDHDHDHDDHDHDDHDHDDHDHDDHDHDDHDHDDHDHDDHDHDDHDHDDRGDTAYDEHIWTSPVAAMTLCRVIARALMEADPVHAENYQARLDDYLSQLAALDRDFRQIVDGAQRHTLVFGDRFPLLYFCRAYGLDYRAAFHGCSGDTEPSLATLKYLIDKVEAESIPVVYTIELSSQKVAKAIADTTGAAVLVFQSCQSVSRTDFDAGETYISLMRRNVEALKEGLR